MKISTKIWLSGAALLLILSFFWMKRDGKLDFSLRGINKEHPYAAQGPCPGETIKRKIRDKALIGLIEPDQEVEIIMNYYACNAIERDDLVYFRYHTEEEPIVRVARGIPGDKIEVVRDRVRGWNIKINGEPLTIGSGEVLRFGGDAIPPLLSAAEQRDNRLTDKEIVLLSNSNSSMRDSLMMGMLSLYDVVGKVVVKSPSDTHKNPPE